MSAALWCAIVVIWGVVLVPVLVRRNEHPDASRRGERLGQAMRVLTRRADGSPRRWVAVPAPVLATEAAAVTLPAGRVIRPAATAGVMAAVLTDPLPAGGDGWGGRPAIDLDAPHAEVEVEGEQPRSGYGEPSPVYAALRRLIVATGRTGLRLGRLGTTGATRGTVATAHGVAAGVRGARQVAHRTGDLARHLAESRGSRRPASAGVRRRRVLAGLLLTTLVALVLAVTVGGHWVPLTLLAVLATAADLAWLRSAAASRRRAATRVRRAARPSPPTAPPPTWLPPARKPGFEHPQVEEWAATGTDGAAWPVGGAQARAEQRGTGSGASPLGGPAVPVAPVVAVVPVAPARPVRDRALRPRLRSTMPVEVVPEARRSAALPRPRPSAPAVPTWRRDDGETNESALAAGAARRAASG